MPGTEGLNTAASGYVQLSSVKNPCVCCCSDCSVEMKKKYILLLQCWVVSWQRSSALKTVFSGKQRRGSLILQTECQLFQRGQSKGSPTEKEVGQGNCCRLQSIRLLTVQKTLPSGLAKWTAMLEKRPSVWTYWSLYSNYDNAQPHTWTTAGRQQGKFKAVTCSLKLNLRYK